MTAAKQSVSMRPKSAAKEQAVIPMLIGGEWRAPTETYEVPDPYRGEITALAPRSSMTDLDDALNAAVSAKAKMAAMPGIEGEHVPLDASAMGAGKICFMLRFPVGVVAGITPFNAPFNLACHKVAPALAAGNTLVLKAPPQSPGVVHELAKIFVDVGTPAGVLNVIYGDRVGPELVRDPRVDFITFTGSTRVGAEIKAASGLRRVALELGGTGTTIVHDDADIAEAAPICARNAMRLAGQSCISVQTVYVHRSLYDRFVELVVAEAGKLKLGDPLDPATDVGTLID